MKNINIFDCIEEFQKMLSIIKSFKIFKFKNPENIEIKKNDVVIEKENKLRNIDERIFKCKDMLYETYSKSTSFDKVVEYSINRIFKYETNHNVFEFYTGYVWNSEKKLCIKNDNSHNKKYEYRIYVSSNSLKYSSVRSYTLRKNENIYDENKIFININNYMLYELLSGDNKIEDIFKDEFINIYNYDMDCNSYLDIICSYYNVDCNTYLYKICSYYDEEEINSDIIKEYRYMIESGLNNYNKLMFYNNESNKENTIKEIRRFILSEGKENIFNIFKKYKHEDNYDETYFKINAVFLEIEKISHLYEYENEIRKLNNDINNMNSNYIPVLSLIYILNKHGNLLSDPIVDDKFIKNSCDYHICNFMHNMNNEHSSFFEKIRFYGDGFSVKKEIDVMNQSSSYFENDMTRYKERIFEVIYNTLNDLKIL